MEEAWHCLVDSDLAGHYQDVELVGLTQLHKKWAYALRFVPKAGDPHIRYYDSESFLLVRMEMTQRFRSEENGPDKAYRVDTDFDDYRVSENLRLPRLLTTSSQRGSLEFRVESVKLNVSIDDSKFLGL
jgi:outer membrane lipoprotein-sorting protein